MYVWISYVIITSTKLFDYVWIKCSLKNALDTSFVECGHGWLITRLLRKQQKFRQTQFKKLFCENKICKLHHHYLLYQCHHSHHHRFCWSSCLYPRMLMSVIMRSTLSDLSLVYQINSRHITLFGSWENTHFLHIQ